MTKSHLCKFILVLIVSGLLACTDHSANSPDPTAPVTENPSAPFNVGKVSFTFDDGLASTYEYALPIFQARSLPATTYIITDRVGMAGYMSWSQIQSLQDENHWEIGSHTLDHAELPLLSDYEIDQELWNSRDALWANGIDVTSIATPYGAYDNRVLARTSRLYLQHRGFWDRDDLNTFPYNNTVLMVESVQRDTLVSNVLVLIDRAKTEKKWLILVFHEVLPNSLPNYEYTTFPEDLETIVDYAVQSGIDIVLPNHITAFEAYNLFALTQDAWNADSPKIEIAPQDSGAYPQATNAYMFTGTDNEIHLYSPSIMVNKNKHYRFKCFVDTLNLSHGEMGIRVEEYDKNKQWLNEVVLNSIGGNKISELLAGYQVENIATASIQVQTYLSAGSVGQALSDHYQLYQLDE